MYYYAAAPFTNAVGYLADERAASMRYMAKAYKKKGNVQTARWWYLKAITEAPHLREPYMDLAWMLYEQQDWDGVLYFTSCALQITERPRTYICEERAWGNMPMTCAPLLCIAPDDMRNH